MEWNFFTVNTSGDWQYAWETIVRLLPVLVPLAIVSTVLMVVAIVGVVRKPNPWNEKILWLLIVILVDIIGPVLYFAVGAGMLDEKFAQHQDREAQYEHPPGGGL